MYEAIVNKLLGAVINKVIAIVDKLREMLGFSRKAIDETLDDLDRRLKEEQEKANKKE